MIVLFSSPILQASARIGQDEHSFFLYFNATVTQSHGGHLVQGDTDRGRAHRRHVRPPGGREPPADTPVPSAVDALPAVPLGRIHRLAPPWPKPVPGTTDALNMPWPARLAAERGHGRAPPEQPCASRSSGRLSDRRGSTGHPDADGTAALSLAKNNRSFYFRKAGVRGQPPAARPTESNGAGGPVPARGCSGHRRAGRSKLVGSPQRWGHGGHSAGGVPASTQSGHAGLEAPREGVTSTGAVALQPQLACAAPAFRVATAGSDPAERSAG